MVADIHGIPPIIITSINEIKSGVGGDYENIREESNNSSKWASAATSRANKKDNKLLAKEEEQKLKADFALLGDKLKEILNEQNLAIEFSMDDATNKMILKLIDSTTNEVIQQYPPEVSLKIARMVASTIDNGIITNAKA